MQSKDLTLVTQRIIQRITLKVFMGKGKKGAIVFKMQSGSGYLYRML